MDLYSHYASHYALDYCIRYVPLIAADRALQWQARREKKIAQNLLYRNNCCDVTSLVTAFLGPSEPVMIPGDAYTRVASKIVRLGYARASYDDLVAQMKHCRSVRTSLRRDLKGLTAKETNWVLVKQWC